MRGVAYDDLQAAHLFKTPVMTKLFMAELLLLMSTLRCLLTGSIMPGTEVPVMPGHSQSWWATAQLFNSAGEPWSRVETQKGI